MARKKISQPVKEEKQEEEIKKVDRTQPGWSNTKPGSPQAVPVKKV
jgi:hypothetical protein